MKDNSLVLAALALSSLINVGVQADSPGAINRLSAEFRWAEFGSSTTASANGADGTLVYTKTLFVPRSTLFVTIHATADVHFGAALQMACLVDGVPCRPEPVEVGGAPTGWVTLQKIPTSDNIATTNCDDGGGGTGDCHDNSVSYSWCTSVDPGVHTVDLKLASSLAGRMVFLEKAQIYLDNTGRRGWDGDDDDDDDDDRRRGSRSGGCAAAPIPQ